MARGAPYDLDRGSIWYLTRGRRPDFAQLLLTPANTLRLKDGLSHLRGAALKLGQMLSMDTGLVHRAVTRDGHELAIKVQYPGVRASIDSDVDNVATLLRLPGLLPRRMDIGPLLTEAKRQLHAEADFLAAATHLTRFGALLERSDNFALPALHSEPCTPHVLTMTHRYSCGGEDNTGATGVGTNVTAELFGIRFGERPRSRNRDHPSAEL